MVALPVHVLLAGAIAPAFTRAVGARRVARIVGGGTFVGLGMFTMFAGNRNG